MREKRRILFGALILFLALILAPVKGRAAEVIATGTGGSNYDITWSLDAEGTLTISGSDCYPACETWKSYRNQVRRVIFEDGITYVGQELFTGYENLTSVRFGRTVETVLRGFWGCPNLKAFEVDAGNTHLMVEDGVLFKKGKTGNILTRCPQTKEGDYVIPDGVTSISYYAFKGCEKLTGITIPDQVESIGEYAFQGCLGLTGITIPDQVEKIESCTFEGCSRLTEVSLPDGLTNLGYGAFAGCDSLKRLKIPFTVTYIEKTAYRGADKVIVGVTGSAAYVHAMKYGITFEEDPCGREHTYDGGKILIPAGYQQEGKILYTCTVCGKTKEVAGGSGLISIRKTAVRKLTAKKGRKKIQVKLEKVSGAEGYQIAYSTSKKFKKAVYKVSTTKTSCTIKKKLKKNKTYYVRARAYKRDLTGAEVYGEWCKAKKIKVRK